MSQVFQILCEALPLATVLMVAALHWSRRRKLPATRGYQLLIAACLLSLLSPLLVGLMPKWQVLPSVPLGLGINQPSAAHPHVPSYPLWFRTLGWLWTAGLVAGLFHLGRQLAGFRTLWRESASAPRDLEALLRRLAARRGITRALQFRVHPGLDSACTWGIRRPVILIAPTISSLPLSELRMVLDHELAHVQRLDAASAWLLQLFATFFWFHPCAWLITRRADLLKERACDDLVLLSGQRPEAYAACLGSTALRTDSLARLPRAASTFARRHPLLARLDAILDSRQARSQSSPEETFRAITPITTFAILLSSLGFKVASEVQPLSPAWISGEPGRLVPSLCSDVVQPAVDIIASAMTAQVAEVSQQITTLPAQNHAISGLPEAPAVAQANSEVGRPTPDAGPGGRSAPPLFRSGPMVETLLPERSQRLESQPDPSGSSSPHRSGIPPFPSQPRLTSDQVLGESAPSIDSGAIPVSEHSESADEFFLLPASDATRSIAAEATQVVDDEGLVFVLEAVPLPPDSTSSTMALTAVDFAGVASGDLRIHSTGVHSDYSDWLAIPELVAIRSEAGEHFAVSVEVPATEAAAWSAEASTDAQTWTDSKDIVAQWMVPGTIAETVRLQAAVTRPVQSSSYRFLRLKARW